MHSSWYSYSSATRFLLIKEGMLDSAALPTTKPLDWTRIWQFHRSRLLTILFLRCRSSSCCIWSFCSCDWTAFSLRIRSTWSQIISKNRLDKEMMHISHASTSPVPVDPTFSAHDFYFVCLACRKIWQDCGLHLLTSFQLPLTFCLCTLSSSFYGLALHLFAFLSTWMTGRLEVPIVKAQNQVLNTIAPYTFCFSLCSCWICLLLSWRQL